MDTSIIVFVPMDIVPYLNLKKKYD